MSVSFKVQGQAFLTVLMISFESCSVINIVVTLILQFAHCSVFADLGIVCVAARARHHYLQVISVIEYQSCGLNSVADAAEFDFRSCFEQYSVAVISHCNC